MNQMSIVLVHYPFTDLKMTKVRPAIILSNETFNQAHAFYWMCPFSTQKTLPEFELIVLPEEHHGILEKQSYIRCDNIMSVAKELVIKEIGKATPKLFEKAIEKIKQNL